MNYAHNRFTWLPTWFRWWQSYFCAQLLALAKPIISFTINRKERTRTDPANWWVLSVSLLILSFSENRLWGLVEFSIDWFSRNCINLGCFSVKHPNELSTRSIHMIANLISVIGKLRFLLIFWPWRSQYLASQSTGKKEHETTQPIDQFFRFSFIVIFWESLVVLSCSALIDIQELASFWVTSMLNIPMN